MRKALLSNKQKSPVPAAVSHDDMVKGWMKDPAFREEKARIEREELGLLDTLLAARDAAGLTQAKIAERMGTKPPAISRLLASLASDKQSPSVATLRKFAAACGKKLEIRLV
ncbi:MAG: helix-turn-helix transcriptional regulator [Gallionella sp.]